MAINFDTITGNRQSSLVLQDINNNFSKINQNSVPNADNATQLNNKSSASYLPGATEFKQSISSLDNLSVGRYFCSQAKAAWEPLATASSSNTRTFVIEVNENSSPALKNYSISYVAGEGAGTIFNSYYNGNNIAWKKVGDDDIFWVTITLDSAGTSIFTVDKSYSDILAAILNNKIVIGKIMGENNSMMFLSTITQYASSLNTIILAGIATTNAYFIISIDNSNYAEIDIENFITVATQYSIGGVKPVIKTSDMTQNIGIDSNGKLWTTPYSLPVATWYSLGGVEPVAKTSAMTQSVGVDSSGALWTSTGASLFSIEFTENSSGVIACNQLYADIVSNIINGTNSYRASYQPYGSNDKIYLTLSYYSNTASVSFTGIVDNSTSTVTNIETIILTLLSDDDVVKKTIKNLVVSDDS